MIALDTETTGVDFRHGSLPFFVSTCDDKDEQQYWEWEVDPYTRKPTIPDSDIEEIKHLVELAGKWGNYDSSIRERHTLILHNSKFDVTALGFVDGWFRKNWPWSMTRDTIIAGHLLDSGNPHNLTDMVTQYLNHDIQPYEDKVESAVQKARRICRSKFPEWLIAKEGLACMPSQKSSGKNKEDKAWHADMWLPKALVQELGYDRITEELEDREHHWDTVLSDYANVDTAATIRLWNACVPMLLDRDLWEIFESRMKLVPITYKMEHRGVTLSKSRMITIRDVFEKEVEKAKNICFNLASNYQDDKGESFRLPQSGNNKHLTDFVFNHLKVPTTKQTDSGNPSLDKEVIEGLLHSLPPRSAALLFFQNLSAIRKRGTALNYIESYQRYWIPIGETENGFRTQNYPQEIPSKSEEDKDVLDVDSREIQGQGVRSVYSSGRGESTSSELQTIQGRDSERNLSTSQLRQSSLCESRPSVSRNGDGQRAGYDSEGKGLQVKRRGPTLLKSDGRASSRDAKNAQGGEEQERARSVSLSQVQTKSSTGIRDTVEEVLEAPSVNNFYRLHPSFNITGTAHLRWSCSQPNTQNISKQEGFNLRYMFGPAPGREWWSLDAQNIELRIPTFEAEEKDLMEVFLKPKEGPYYGSYHLVVFDALYPELFKKHGKDVKDLFESTYYQWVKNGNFALIYGCQKKKADETFHYDGAYEKVRYRFPKIAKLADRQIAIANRTGGIETIPDKTVNPRRGYPIKCSFGNWGKVQPTLPLNYHVSGSAMQWMGKAMMRTDEILEKWIEQTNFDAFITMQVHDELVFDMPKSKVDPTEDKSDHSYNETKPWMSKGSNLWRVKQLQKAMELGGEDIGVPTPVAIEYNPVTWDKGIRL